jgi:hypothetical protein
MMDAATRNRVSLDPRLLPGIALLERLRLSHNHASLAAFDRWRYPGTAVQRAGAKLCEAESAGGNRTRSGGEEGMQSLQGSAFPGGALGTRTKAARSRAEPWE